jgi:hypothetical protein
MGDLRSMIREVLAEELRALKATGGGSANVQRETVAIASDHDLDAFARRIVQLAADPSKRDAILSGRHVFSLAAAPAPVAHYVPANYYAPPPPPPLAPIAHSAPAPAASVARQSFSKGLMTEKDVEALPDGTRVVTVGKSVRFTPLASDELRRLNIKIERTAA